MKIYDTSVKLKQRGSVIEARDLINLLWKYKLILIIIPLIFAIVAAIFNIYFVKPVYKTTFTIYVNIPSAYSTKYGNFTSPINNNIDYINLIKSNEVIEKTIASMGYNTYEVSIESINSRITIGEEDTSQNIFPIIVSGHDPQEIVDLSNKLYNTYIGHVDLIIKDRAINYFYNDFSVKLESDQSKLQSNNDLLRRYEDLIETTPQLIDQEGLLKAFSEASNYIVLDDITNPNYIELQNTLIETKKIIETTESNIATYNAYLEELELEKAALEKFYQEGGLGRFESSLLDTSDVFVLSQAMVPSDKVSPNLAANVVTAGLLGNILSIGLVFFRSYMKREI
ncbi:MAG: hypothetical protein GX323_09385 [Clostridiales bacterium]|nr:hypothetical protein [Clostridiales bacterium]